MCCLSRNMVQKPVPNSTATTDYVSGEVLQVDIKVFADTSKARKHLRALGNHVGALTAVDTTTGYRFGTLIKSNTLLKIQLRAARVQVCASDRA